MVDEYVSKGIIGLRYLIKYMESGSEEDYNIVQNNLSYVKLWLIIIFFANNTDTLGDDIPDNVLKSIFNMEDLLTPDGTPIPNLYGEGYKTSESLSYKKQFMLIRNTLSHLNFTFYEPIVYLEDGMEFKTLFDIKWLETLGLVAISTGKYALKKGMSDVCLIGCVKNESYTHEQFLELIEKNLLGFYKVTALTNSKEAYANLIEGNTKNAQYYTFYIVTNTVKKIMEVSHARGSSFKEGLFKDVEKLLKNKVKLEFIKVNTNDEVFSNPEFIELPFYDKLQYLIDKYQSDNPTKYNSISLNGLLSFFKKYESGDVTLKDKMSFKDTYDFLVKAYANAVFSSSRFYKKSDGIIDKYNFECRYVHASNVYHDYIKVLRRYYKELLEHGGSLSDRKDVLSLIDSYNNSLLDIEEGKDPIAEFYQFMRHAIIHNHIEYIGDNIRFFVTGTNLELKHYHKKSKTWVDKEFINKQPIWEFVINKYDFLSLLDDISIARGINLESDNLKR